MNKCLVTILFVIFLTPSSGMAKTACYFPIKTYTSYSDQGAFLKGVFKNSGVPFSIPVDSIKVVVDESKDSVCIQSLSPDYGNFIVRVPSESIKKRWDYALLVAEEAFVDHLLGIVVPVPVFKGKE